MEPQRFAAQLISRLETVLREREAQERLEERLKRVRLVSRLLSFTPPLAPFIASHEQHLAPSARRKKRGTMLTSP